MSTGRVKVIRSKENMTVALLDIQRELVALQHEKKVCCTMGEGWNRTRELNVEFECEQLKAAELKLSEVIAMIRRGH